MSYIFLVNISVLRCSAKYQPNYRVSTNNKQTKFVTSPATVINIWKMHRKTVLLLFCDTQRSTSPRH